MMVIRKHKRKFEWWTIPALRIFPFMNLGQGIRWLWHTIFFDRIRTHEDDESGIKFSYSIFSWGKLSFVIVILLFILEIFHILLKF